MSDKYYQAANEKTLLQMTMTKEGLIISVMKRSLGGNGDWSTITLNADQINRLKEFLK